MEDEIVKALRKKKSAQDEREFGSLKRAISLIEDATRQLEELWEQRGPSIDRAGADAGPDDRSLVEALAETYGVKGGIYRSANQPEQAVAAYNRGLVFEQHAARKVDNSYNLVQRLTTRVLAAPHLVGAPEWNVESLDMWRAIEDTADELERQIRKTRGNDPWAAADVITIEILLAPKRLKTDGQQIKRVEKACEEFGKLSPKPFVCESTLRTLKDIKSSMEEVPAQDRSEIQKHILKLLDVAIEHLEQEFERAKAR